MGAVTWAVAQVQSHSCSPMGAVNHECSDTGTVTQLQSRGCSHHECSDTGAIISLQVEVEVDVPGGHPQTTAPAAEPSHSFAAPSLRCP